MTDEDEPAELQVVRVPVASKGLLDQVSGLQQPARSHAHLGESQHQDALFHQLSELKQEMRHAAEKQANQFESLQLSFKDLRGGLETIHDALRSSNHMDDMKSLIDGHMHHLNKLGKHILLENNTTCDGPTGKQQTSPPGGTSKLGTYIPDEAISVDDVRHDSCKPNVKGTKFSDVDEQKDIPVSATRTSPLTPSEHATRTSQLMDLRKKKPAEDVFMQRLECVAFFVILCNTVVMVAQTEMAMDDPNAPSHVLFDVCELFFTTVYIIEITLKLHRQRLYTDSIVFASNACF